MEDMKLDEIRNQFAILKEQLNKQEIVSERLLRETMKTNNKSISDTKRMVSVCGVMCLVLYPLSYFTHVWSLAFAIGTCLMVIFCVAATYYIHHPVERLNFMKDDFSTVARVMAKFKKDYHNWIVFVTPTLLIPWLSWACYEVAWKHAPKGSNPWLMSLPIIIGAVIGAVIGYRYHRKAVNAAQNIIDEIDEV